MRLEETGFAGRIVYPLPRCRLRAEWAAGRAVPAVAEEAVAADALAAAEVVVAAVPAAATSTLT